MNNVLVLFIGAFLGGFIAEFLCSRTITLQLEKSISLLEKRIRNLE